MSNRAPETVEQVAAEVNKILKSVTAPWPGFSGGQQEAFAEFQRVLKQEFNLTLWDELFKLNSAEVNAINSAHVKAMQRSPMPTNQYDADDWNQMIAVVCRVLAYKDTIATAFEGQRVYMEGVQLIFSNLTTQTIKGESLYAYEVHAWNLGDRVDGQKVNPHFAPRVRHPPVRRT